MKTETWLDHMVNEIKKSEKKEDEPATVKLSESDMNNLADIMIKKMADNPDSKNETQTPSPKETNKPKSDDPDETPIE